MHNETVAGSGPNEYGPQRQQDATFKSRESVLSCLSLGSRIVTRAGICPLIANDGSIGLGELRAQLFNFVVARHASLKGSTGISTLRCDDTDPSRCDLRHLPQIYDLLTRIIGIPIDIHPFNSNQLVGYSMIQTERGGFYQRFVDLLLHGGYAYRDSEGQAVFFDVRKFIEIHGDVIEAFDGNLGVLRHVLKPQGGKQGETSDFPIVRSNGSALWHLTSTVDDFLTGVNYVVRARDKLGNVPYQEMVRIALGFPEKEYLHIPLLMNPSAGEWGYASTFHQLLRAGYFAQGIVSYLLSSVYGSPEASYLSLDEFAVQFDPKKLHRSQGAFDKGKLDAANRRVLVRLSAKEYLTALRVFAEVTQDAKFGELLDIPGLAKLLGGEKRMPIAARQLALTVSSPVYTEPPHELRSELFNCVQELRASLATSNGQLSLRLEDPPAVDAHRHKAMRWILLGETVGPDWRPILKYLLEQGIVSERLEKASGFLSDLK